MFAKLFGSPADQVLGKLGTNEEGTVGVKVYFRPEESGPRSVELSSVGDSEEDWLWAEALFASIDEVKARKIIAAVCERLGLTTQIRTVGKGAR